MCIRDSCGRSARKNGPAYQSLTGNAPRSSPCSCLLYTSDAADDLTRVDLGGRRVFQAEDGIRDLVRSRGLGDVYKRQLWPFGAEERACVPELDGQRPAVEPVL